VRQNKNMATGSERSAGFTIVETPVVLAVSGMLAASAMLMLNGKQSKTEFQVAANGMKQQLEQIINNTANGAYASSDPISNGLTCNGAVSPTSITTASSGQGTNSTCILLGNVVEFGIGSGSSSAQNFTVYPLVGKRYKFGTTTEVTNFTDAEPIALAPDNLNNTHGIDRSMAYKTQNGLSFYQATYIDTSGNPITPPKPYVVLAFADSLSQYQARSDGTLNSSTQNLDLYEYDIPWSPPAPTDSKSTVTKINGSIPGSTPIKAVQLCFVSGGTNQSAQLTVSGNGQLAVDLKVFGDRQCA